MQQIYSPTIFDVTTLTCPKCTWEGKGADTTQENLFLTDATEIFCPSCQHYFGFLNIEEIE